MEILKLLLPVFWAVVSTGVGVILYRTSSALFESKQLKDGTTRRLRLAGSVTIAALAFLGMWYATPRESLQPNLNGYAQYKVEAINRIADLAQQINDKAVDLSACLNEPQSDCRTQALDLQSLASQSEIATSSARKTAIVGKID
ncbi:hypothetical protein X727_33005 [Mesorhizobium sp. L103C119B0]|uniref:hypothetical protein n=1 Tax=Mesorhizobium sp. L103C119B0 TaxID=1287085 RepID=UPI0003CF9E31|nr:hypothetical protein [Mesorhizobium sp. L103C119B0]ESZ56002.1 hypothetical protein X727_33005 [Mesorhizobium sp. L103C119B0]